MSVNQLSTVQRDIYIKTENDESNGSKVTIFEILPKDCKCIYFTIFVILKKYLKKEEIILKMMFDTKVESSFICNSITEDARLRYSSLIVFPKLKFSLVYILYPVNNVNYVVQ